MNFWRILDINPTDNVSEVKKAYAKKLKLHHPEDDPEGYQELREAYDGALKYIKSKMVEKTIESSIPEKVNEVSSKEEELESEVKPLPHVDFSAYYNEVPSFQKSVEEFIDKVKILYNDFFSRINTEKWIEILNSEVMWYMGDKKLLSDNMIEFLMGKHYLPQNVWKLLYDNFNWKEQKEYLYENYPKEFVEYLFKQIEDNNGLRYCYFKKIEGVPYETFLDYREKAFEALSNGKFEYAEECISNANNIYAEDPDVLILQARCYVNRGDVDKALDIYEKLIQNDDNDVCARFYKAKLLHDMGEMEKVLNECKVIESIGFDNLDFKLFAANCHMYFKEAKKAKELLVQLKGVVRLQAEVEALLKQVNLELVRDLRKSHKKNKEVRAEIDELYKEIGRLTDGQLKRKLKWIFIRRLIIFLVILLIQVINIQSAMKVIGIKDYHSLSNTLKFAMFFSKGDQVNSSEDINKLPIDISNVKGKLTDAAFLSLYRIPVKDEKGQVKDVYLSYDTAKKRNLYGDMNGYLCVGTLGDKKIVAVVNYKEATQAYKSKTIDFDSAVLHKITDTKLLNKIEKLYGTKTFVEDRFIDTKVTVSGSRKHTLNVDAWLLFIQLAFILLGVTSAIKLIRVNRR